MSDKAVNDPYGAFDTAREAYLRYLDSPFRLRYDALLDERRAMFDQDRQLYRDPLFEVIPPYESSGLTVPQAFARLGISQEAAEFVGTGLFRPEQPLFVHQFDAIERVWNGRATVVTTGTGSGKTECYLLPIFAYLAEESARWLPVQAPRASPYWRTPGQRRASQRDHEAGGRPAAVRALLMYPLNALIEDQLARIRSACNSPETLSWLDQRRHGNRFWYGRYVGSTPVAGVSSNANARQRLRERLLTMDEDFRRASDAARASGNARILSYFQDPLSSEMWSRWDMQDTPPDILITNYSMLNIMLMRDVEQDIFEHTKQWLEADRARNVFHLVVDEIHSYRGTPGTEVAYLLRSLLRRIGLTPDSHQLRIIATSASQGDVSLAKQHLSQFFGRQAATFEVVSGKKSALPRPASLDRIRECKDALASLANASDRGLAEGMQALNARFNETGAPYPAAFVHRCAVPGLLEELSLERPFLLEELAVRTFGNQDAGSIAAARGLLRALVATNSTSGGVVPQIRVHCFFHNAGRIWACVNPQCHEQTAFALPGDPPPVGRLFPEPQPQCPHCHSRVLELLYCQPCGEVFLGGYKTLDGVPNAYFLSPDYPELERVPDRTLSLLRVYGEYAVFWPARGRPLADGHVPPGAQAPTRWTWQENGQAHSWNRAALNRVSGRVALGVLGNETTETAGFCYVAAQPEDEAFPSKCPHCAADWRTRRIPSPIRDLGSGFQRTVQLLNDAVMRELPPKVRKVVVFSDSRLDAAKLSTGIKLAHYRDVVRQITYDTGLNASLTAAHQYSVALQEHERARRLLEIEHQILQRDVSTDAIAERTELLRALPTETAISVMTHAAAGGNAPRCLERPAPPEAVTGIPFGELVVTERETLLSVGINPGGPSRSVRELRLQAATGQPVTVDWTELVDWTASPRAYKASLEPLEQQLIASIEVALRRALIEDVLFADGSRDCESLRIGYLWIRQQPPNGFEENVAASVIRILLQGRRWLGSEREGRNTPPRAVQRFLDRVELLSGNQITQQVVDILRPAMHQWLMNVNLLFLLCPSFTDAKIEAYVCPRCTRLHMHQSGGICTRCREQLAGAPTRESFDPQRMDYYEFLARCTEAPFRLNSEELTGQTNPSDRLSRQRRFQGVFMTNETPEADGIDLLSVTTTMEAGVDIGDLQTIGLANMPPMRFNYQQRVGRAGRRGDYGMSLIMTVCRGRSHDEYYFQRPTLITSELPPPPYVDVARRQILLRVLNKEVLFYAFRGIPLPHSSDDVHGEFGDLQSWAGHRQAVESWLADNHAVIQLVAESLVYQTAFTSTDDIAALVDFVEHDLMAAIDSALADPNIAGQKPVSQRLAEEGLLPMFGFPTRIRNLYHQRPRIWNGAIDEESGIIDRQLDVAISQFAPGAQTVKDDELLTSVGIVDYRIVGNRVVEAPDPLGRPIPIGLCRRCQALVENPPGMAQCPFCLAAGGAGGYRTVSLSQPPGFCTWYQIHADFSGGFEFAPRALRARMGAASSKPLSKRNFVIDAISQARVYRINDNDGNDFAFRKLAGNNVWITEDGFEQAVDDLPQGDRNRIARPQFDANTPIETRALASISRTDVLTVTLRDVPLGLSLNPSVPEARAAWYSLGFMLRRAMAVTLDVAESELDVGIQPVLDFRNPFAPPSARIFISDALENGAGYSTHFSDPGRFEALLQFMLDDQGITSFAGPLVSFDHANACSTSCYRCLREYGNMPFHPLLDWRLGLDMARLALDATTAIDLSFPYWADLLQRIAPIYFDGLGFSDVSGRGFVRGESPIDGSWTIVTHPLWDESPANFRTDVAAAYVQAELAGHRARIRSLFRIARFPYE